MNLLPVFSALALFVAAGACLVRIADRRGETGLSGGPWLAATFILGLGAISLQMFLYSLASISYGPLAISAPWIILALVVFFALKRGAPAAPTGPKRPKPGLIGVALILLILSQAAYSFLYALTLPLAGWDAWFIWFLKARVFFLDRGVSSQFLIDPFYQHHQDYPLLIPLAISWVYTAVGSADEVWGKLLFPLQFVSMLSLFHYAVARSAGGRTPLVFTALLSMTPVVVMHAGGLPARIGGLYAGDFVGYADLALSMYFLCAGAFYFLYASEGKRPFLALSALFLGMGAWTKNEGLTFAIFAMAIVVLGKIIEGRCAFRDSLLFVAITAAFIVPWTAYRTSIGVGSEYVEALSISIFYNNLWKLKAILPSMGKMMFLKVSIFNFCWWAYFASCLVNFRVAFSKGLLALNALILLQLLVYIFIYIISPAPIDWHLQTSVDRLLLHLLPAAVFVAALNLGSLVDRAAGQRAG